MTYQTARKTMALFLSLALVFLAFHLPVGYMEPEPSGEFAAFEAEAPGNTLAGNAAVKDCEACSGGAKVGDLYMGSSLEIPGIAAPEDGVYKLRIQYTSGDPRSVYIAANGGEGERFDLPKTEDWDTPGVYEVWIELQQGSNTLLFYDNNWYAPDIDMIEVAQAPSDGGGGETPQEEKGYEFEAEAAVNTLSGNAEVKECGVCSGGAIVEGLYEGSSLAFNEVSVPTAGEYKLRIHYISGDPRAVYIGVNGGPDDKYDLPASPSWSTPDTYEITLSLAAGDNTILFSDQDGYSPNIDKIVVIPNKQSYEAEAPGNTLTGNASVSDCDACSGGQKVGGIYMDSSVVFPDIEVFAAGEYELTLHYISGDPRSFYVSVNGAEAEKVDPPATADWDTVGAYSVTIALEEGVNTIAISDGNWYAPDLDRIEISRTSTGGPGETGGEAGDIGAELERASFGAIQVAEHEHGLRLTHPAYTITYNTDNGYADYAMAGQAGVKGAFSAVKLDGEEISSLDYDTRSYSLGDIVQLDDEYGTGIRITIVNEHDGLPTLKQMYELYEERDYFFKQDEWSADTELATNYIAPLAVSTKGGIDVGSYTDNRVLVAPFDNDQWSTYQARTMNTAYNNHLYESSELTAMYDNTSRNGFVIGSASHDTWKTGIYWSGSNNRVDQLRVYGGYASDRSTHDTIEHGIVSGLTIASPKLFVGYFTDYRDGLESYGEANAIAAPPLAFGENIPDGVPVGWNSWGAYASELDYEKMLDVSNYFKEKLQHESFNNEGTLYINMDSYWDMLTDEQIRHVVETIHDNGQKAGIYWGPFVYWGNNMNQIADGTDDEYTYGELVLRDANGEVLPTLSGAYALDPTHPGTQKRISHYLNRFKDYGFEFIKLDFLTHGSLEGDHYDPEVQTGIQAYNIGMQYVIDQLDDTMFVSASIAPLFPSQYAHSRRISCDIDGTLPLTQYQLNNQTYGWWQNGTIYHYTDPDYMTLKKGGSYNAAQTRVNSVVISGTLFLGSDDVRDEQAQEYMEQLLTNPRVNEVALKGKAFRPVEGNTGTNASDVFVLAEEDHYYLSVFNYTQSEAEKTVSLARAGIDADKVKVTDLWTGETFEAETALNIALEGAQSKLYRIDAIATEGPGQPQYPVNPGPGAGSGGDPDEAALSLPAGLVEEGAAATDLSQALEVTSDNRTARATLQHSAAEQLLRAAGAGAAMFAIRIPMTAEQDGVSLQLGKETLRLLAVQGGAQAELLLLSDAGHYRLPLHVLPEDAEEIEISILRLPDEEARYAPQLPAGFRALQTVSFEIGYKDGDGEVHPLSGFGNVYVNRSMDIGSADPSAAYVAWAGESGQLTPVPTRIVRQADGSHQAVFSRTGNSVYVLLEGSRTFGDIQGHWGAEIIEKLASRLLVNGKSEEAFDPQGQVTRAEFAALAVRALGARAAEYAPLFSDVRANDWHGGEIAAAVELGLIQGYEDGTFRPDKPIAREELAVMLARAIAYTDRQPSAAAGSFAPTDIDAVSPWASDAVEASLEAGILLGDDAGRLRPGDGATRAEAAAMLYRFMKAVQLID